MKYQEYKQLDLTRIGEEIRKYWEDNDTFEKGQHLSEGHPSYVFYDGPPSANGKPGIHHVMARTIKDLFCRYKAQKGYHVDRKAGWDTHGLPVELGVEKNLGITKEDIGKKISVDDYNHACRTEVLKYKDLWDELTKQMGYWVDLKHPYITFENEYIESLWFLLKKLYDKGLLYKGYTIQPFSPAAGTGLSSHELNLPGCYRDVKDTTCVAMFRLSDTNDTVASRFNTSIADLPTFAIAWTTTPWTLPSNTALCVGPSIDYQIIRTLNPYTATPCHIIMAKALVASFFKENDIPMAERFEAFKAGDKELPYEVLGECKGRDLEGLRYEQLIPWVKPTGNDAFRIILGDYVTTEDGTGIVHIAPTFGADDARVAKKAGIGELFLFDRDGKQMPMVDRSGRIARLEDLDPAWTAANIDTDLYSPYAGKYVKNAYDSTKTDKDISLDIEIVVMLKGQGKLFKSEKHTHSYPHCWRTDKPVLYYPLDSWFIRTTAVKERLIELNRTINWKPEATGTGRFGNWLENIVDWNLSRSRYWGTPLPIWRTEDGREEICIGSVNQLRQEIDKAVAAGLMNDNPYKSDDYTAFDLHRPYIDNVILLSPSGKPMRREPDLIDVWFDSGAMPYAQIHYMGEPDKLNASNFPADFIAEGVDQTRGWFYTLHALATMCFDSVAFRNVISNGLVLDKNGNKMSKRLGNAVDPFETLKKYGPDATRWYMITNSQPWDNLKFDVEGVDEVRRKLFGTLYNTYSFFALYANIDGFQYKEADLPSNERPEIDRWILSQLNTLIKDVDSALDDYEPTRAGRAIQEFVDAYLSNWYVRLCRRRFWKGDYSADKISAYQTLYTCLETIARLMAPIAPFFSERMFTDLNAVTNRHDVQSVHHCPFPTADDTLIDKELEERMQLAQQICSMGLSLRKKSNLRVRQPLSKITIPIRSDHQRQQINAVANLICSELNIKDIEFLATDNNLLVKKIKANFKTLGPRYGKIMKTLGNTIAAFSQQQINTLENEGHYTLTVEGQPVELTLADVEIATQDIPGWVVANEGSLTVALDITLTDALREEGMAREIVNRIQNIRKEGYDVTDRIIVTLQHGQWDNAVANYHDYICNEILATEFHLVDTIDDPQRQQIEIIDGTKADILVRKA